MPHSMTLPRPRRVPIHDFNVVVNTPEGRSTFTISAQDADVAKREAIRLYANEHDSPVTAWAEIH